MDVDKGFRPNMSRAICYIHRASRTPDLCSLIQPFVPHPFFQMSIYAAMVRLGQKGGTGKTNLAKVLLVSFGADGKSCLGIDLDPQASLYPRPEIQAVSRLRSQKRPKRPQVPRRRQGPGTDLYRQLGRCAAMHGHDALRQGAAKPDPQAIVGPATQERSGHRDAGNRTDRTDTVHHRVGARYGHAAPVHGRAQQRRSTPFPEERLVDRPSKRAGLDTPEHLLRHISPLGWEHILLIGQYIWRKMSAEIALRFITEP